MIKNQTSNTCISWLLYFPLCRGKVTVEPGIEISVKCDVAVSFNTYIRHSMRFSTEIELKRVARLVESDHS